MNSIGRGIYLGRRERARNGKYPSNRDKIDERCQGSSPPLAECQNPKRESVGQGAGGLHTAGNNPLKFHCNPLANKNSSRRETVARPQPTRPPLSQFFHLGFVSIPRHTTSTIIPPARHHSQPHYSEIPGSTFLSPQSPRSLYFSDLAIIQVDSYKRNPACAKMADTDLQVSRPALECTPPIR